MLEDEEVAAAAESVPAASAVVLAVDADADAEVDADVDDPVVTPMDERALKMADNRSPPLGFGRAVAAVLPSSLLSVDCASMLETADRGIDNPDVLTELMLIPAPDENLNTRAHCTRSHTKQFFGQTPAKPSVDWVNARKELLRTAAKLRQKADDPRCTDTARQ